jgi:glutamate carboxypeptidase
MQPAGTEADVLAWLADRRAEMVTLLQALVNVDSGSHDRDGVNRAGEVLAHFLAGHGLDVEVTPGERVGDGLTVRLPAAGGHNVPGPVLLLGHRDTVFPKGEAERRPFRVEGERAFGPGVADMKAGLVMNAFVMAAFAAKGGAPVPLVMLTTADEEIASPEGRALIEATAQDARCVFNAEPGRPGGGIVTSRNGGLFCDVAFSGRAAHSGASHRHGASAIEAAARKVQALHALTDYEKGVTLNVGLISGGEALNTVAPFAHFAFDCRFPTQLALVEIEPLIDEVLARTELEGTSQRVTSRRLFLPVEESARDRRLFEHYAAAAAEIGLPAEPVFSGGSADSGFTSALGVPTLCGTGPIGEHAHTAHEVCHLDTLVPRAQAVALAIMRLEA